jgi:hypothetical protein
MATNTIGTAATSTLTGLVYSRALSDLDVATIAAGIKQDLPTGGPPSSTGAFIPGAFNRAGLLWVPNRGFLQVLPGDVVAFDATVGWPILVSAGAAASAAWVHVP